MNPHDEQKITSRDEIKKARAAKRASAAAFLPANDRFKQSYSALTYLGVILATAFHFAVFEFFPQLEAADLGSVSEELSAIELPRLGTNRRREEAAGLAAVEGGKITALPAALGRARENELSKHHRSFEQVQDQSGGVERCTERRKYAELPGTDVIN